MILAKVSLIFITLLGIMRCERKTSVESSIEPIKCDSLRQQINSNPDGFALLTETLVRTILPDLTAVSSNIAEYRGYYLASAGKTSRYRLGYIELLTTDSLVYAAHFTTDERCKTIDSRIFKEYCSSCSWAYYSRSAPVYDLTGEPVLGFKIYFYDTLQRGRVIHVDYLQPVDSSYFEIQADGTFVEK
jgi:hypothetical protein